MSDVRTMLVCAIVMAVPVSLVSAQAIPDNFFVSAGEPIAGDINLDGDVDLVDLGTFSGNFDRVFHRPVTWADGDFDGDGDVDLVDFGLLSGNYGYGVPAPLNLGVDASGFSVVPEPGTMVLLALGGLALHRRRQAGS